MWEEEDALIRVPIHNPTLSPVSIAGFRTSCNCAGVEPRTLTVPAGGSADVLVRVNLTERGPVQVGLSRRQFSVEVCPVVPNGTTAGCWRVRCCIVSRATLNQQSLEFGEIARRGESPRSRRIVVQTHIPCDGVTALAEGDAVRVRAESDGAGRFVLHLTPNTARQVGPFETKVRVFRTDDDGSAGVELCQFVARGELRP